MKNVLFIFLLCFTFLTSCWPTSISFNDTGSLHACLKYFEMEQLENSAANAPINYQTDLTEAIKSGIQNNTKLLISSEKNKPQVFLNGKIVSYSVIPIALQQGDNAAQNRLSVSVSMDIIFDCSDENYSHEMKLNSTRFADFDANIDISSVENQLITEINKQIVQDVINQILSNW
jgi:outer membrane lipopolysaccharide assembly protein LptE/RlpB